MHNCGKIWLEVQKLSFWRGVGQSPANLAPLKATVGCALTATAVNTLWRSERYKMHNA